jgi:hypothetical protein
MSVLRRTLPLAAAALLLGACRDTKIVSYRVPHEADPAPVTPAAPAAAGAGSAMASTPVATTAGMALAWTAPAHWQSKPATSMRKATYTLAADGAEAELAITAFPGDVGGDLANVNRWRGQVGLGNLSAAELAGATQHLDVNGLHLTVVDYTGQGASAGQRLLGAIVPIDAKPTETWFFKLSGPAALLGRERDAFLEFLKSIRKP